MFFRMLVRTCPCIGSVRADKGTGKGDVAKGEAKGKGEMPFGQGAGNTCTARIGFLGARTFGLDFLGRYLFKLGHFVFLKILATTNHITGKYSDFSYHAR